VPLNAGNVLVIEDNEPAARWLALLNRALNQPVDTDADIFQHKPSPSLDSTSSQSTPGLDGSFSNRSRTASGSIIFQKSLKSIRKSYMPSQRKQLKFCNCPVEMAKKSYKDACFRCPRPQAYANEMDSSEEDELEDKLNDIFGLNDDGVTSSASASRDQLKYNLISCKQMVGIFVTVWAKKELAQHIGHLRTSCVGRGIMGYLGNKVRGKKKLSESIFYRVLEYGRGLLGLGWWYSPLVLGLIRDKGRLLRSQVNLSI
jgi:hypothetical protein